MHTYTHARAHTLSRHTQTDRHQHGCVRAQTSPHTRENKSRKTRTSGNLVDVIETLLDAFLQDRLHACMREKYVCACVCPCVCDRKKEAAYHKGVASSAPAIIFHLRSCWQHECSYLRTSIHLYTGMNARTRTHAHTHTSVTSRSILSPDHATVTDEEWLPKRLYVTVSPCLRNSPTYSSRAVSRKDLSYVCMCV